MSDIFCQECNKKIKDSKESLICDICGKEICFDCAYSIDGITKCPDCNDKKLEK